jgi:L-iditol 2-dehydrogenase
VTIDPSKEDAKAILQGLTGGYGCDVYIETTGAPVGVNQGLDMIRKLGRFVEFSVFGKDTSVDWSIIGDRKELDVRGAHLGPYCYPIAIDLFERGLITSRGIVTHDFPLGEWEQAFKLANSLDSIKVLLKPGAA